MILYKDLTKLACSYLETYECRNLFEIALIIYGGENIWNVTKETIEVLPVSSFYAD